MKPNAPGRAGGPLYLMYDADGSDAVVMPQFLTEGGMIAALEAAAT